MEHMDMQLQNDHHDTWTTIRVSKCAGPCSDLSHDALLLCKTQSILQEQRRDSIREDRDGFTHSGRIVKATEY